jgi:ANTAR domain-containing protein/GAF domain-containing protein
MDPIHDTTAALLELTESLTPDESREALLHRVATQVLQVLPDADGVTVILATNGKASTITTTDDALLALDQAQYEQGDGPCLQALRTQTMVHADLDGVRQHWPRFAQAADTAGIGSTLSCPLFLPADDPAAHRHASDQRLSGALNIWSSKPAAFDPLESALITVFTSAVSAVILTAARWAAARAQTDQLRIALNTRDAISTAKGIVMARRHLTIDEAFTWLTDISQHTNLKIRDFVDLIIANPDLVGTAS